MADQMPAAPGPQPTATVAAWGEGEERLRRLTRTIAETLVTAEVEGSTTEGAADSGNVSDAAQIFTPIVSCPDRRLRVRVRAAKGVPTSQTLTRSRRRVIRRREAAVA